MSDPMARSPLNPADMAFAKQSGQVQSGMPFGQFLEQSFGVKWDDPVEVAAQKLQQKAKSALPVGKAQAMAQPVAQPQAAPPQQRPQGLDALVG